MIKSLFHIGPIKINHARIYRDHDRLIHVDPDKIETRIIPFFRRFVPNYYFTYVAAGNWDRRYADSDKIYPQSYLDNGRESRYGDDEKLFPKEFPHRMTLLPIKLFDQYISYENHFINGVPWEDTLFYQRRLNEGFKTSRYDTEDGLIRRLEFIDKLYNQMKLEGYKTQQELRNEGDLEAKGWQHEVQINIGRTGELILDDGRNRLILAKLLNIKNIPVRVLVRHKQWQEIRKDIHSNGFSEKYEELRDHPDLQDVIS